MSFDGFKALNDLTLVVDAGELRCVIGPNGAGKTTMMDVITGKTRPDAGTAFFGQTIDLTRLSEPEIADRGIGRKFQKPTVFTDHTVFENLELARKADKRVWPTLTARLDSDRARPHPRDPRHDQACAGGGPPGRAAVARPEAVARDRHAADAGAAAAAARRAGRRHDRRRDDAQRRALRVARGRLHAVVVEHDMDFVARIADRVTVLHEGHVLAEGSMEQVQRNEQVIEVFLGR